MKVESSKFPYLKANAERTLSVATSHAAQAPQPPPICRAGGLSCVLHKGRARRTALAGLLALELGFCSPRSTPEPAAAQINRARRQESACIGAPHRGGGLSVVRALQGTL